ncbi:ABC transporter permease subunit [Celerinatantimonas diazotrophica]|nr:autoinducer 2 import system permease LsrD [Celerinatantimonas diazotrophica]
MMKLKNISWEIWLLIIIVLEIILFGLFNSRMFNFNVLLYGTNDFIYIAFLAVPLTMIIVSGGIDLSFGSVVGLCAISLGVLYKSDMPFYLAVLVTFIIGAGCGLLNALLIILTGVNPLVITLGTMYLYSGAALLISGTAGATGYEGISDFPGYVDSISNGLALGIPLPIIYFTVFVFIFYIILHRLNFGRSIFFIGQNMRASRYSTINVNRITLINYMLMGISSAAVALMLVSYFGSARSDLGSSFLMPVITAAVLGGANIYGGEGSIFGSALAAFLIGYLQQGLQMVGVSTEMSNAVSGGLLICVLIVKSVSHYSDTIMHYLKKSFRHENREIKGSNEHVY